MLLGKAAKLGLGRVPAMNLFPRGDQSQRGTFLKGTVGEKSSQKQLSGNQQRD